LVLFSQTEKHTNIRIACVPRGPTLSYRVTKYALGKDVRSLQKNPVDVVAAFKSSPLVVLNNFSKDVSHQKLAATTFQNMFPAINIQSIKLKECRRVVLYNYNPETDEIEFRHYAVRAAPTGLNKSVKKLIQAKVPNLGNAEDIADIILGGGGGGGGDAYASDSDFEDEESHVVLPDNYVGKGNKKSNKSAIKLAELGPRMTLKLVKVQDEVCAGDVLYHAFETKDSAEAAIIKEKVAAKKAKKEERIAIQTANVLKKKQALEEKLAKKREKRKLNLDNDSGEGEEEEDGDDDDAGDADDAGEREDEDEGDDDEDEEGAPALVPGEEEEDDDLEWYRQETGSEPDDVMKLAAKYKRQQALENAEKKALEEKNGPVKKRPRVQFEDDSKDDSKKGRGKDKGKGEKKREDTPGPKGWSRTKSIGGVKRKEGGLFGSKEGSSKKPRHH
jgi:ribosome biogenesis protein SSF1/2